MQIFLMMLHVLIAISLIALVLMQQGKGSDMGAGFGAGASGTVFGARGAASFLVKLTGALAILFMATSITLAIYAAKSNKGVVATGVTNLIQEQENQVQPAVAPQITVIESKTDDAADTTSVEADEAATGDSEEAVTSGSEEAATGDSE